LLLLGKRKDKKAKALGYVDGDITQHNELLAADFVGSPNPLLLLSQASSVVFDEELTQSVHTTSEVCYFLYNLRIYNFYV
jgi:hypothetical protein